MMARWSHALALALLVGMPSWPPEPAAPDVHGYWGMALGMYPQEARRRGFEFPPDIEELAELGATHVTLAVPWHMADVHASEIAPGSESIDDSLFLSVAARIRRAGLAPVVVPFLRLSHASRHDWRGVIAPTDRDAWWRSYDRFILHYARLAEEAHAPLLAIGSELTTMTGPADSTHWATLGTSVRHVFSGRIAYVTNHDALDRRAALPYVDIAGVSAYFELTSDADADAETLDAAWARVARELTRFGREAQRPVVLFEVGYPSADGGAVHPWDYTVGSMVDLEEQRRAYHAAISAINDSSRIEGALFWTWFGPGGAQDRWYTPRGKPAELELRRLLRSRTR